MKRMKKLLACALAALLLILPAAMAEESAMVEAHTITIENPSMTMMGIPMADLDGLSLEATYAGDENDCAFLLRLLGGEEVAAEGLSLIHIFDGCLVHIRRHGVVDVQQRHALAGHAGADELGQRAVDVYLARRGDCLLYTSRPPASAPASRP